MEDGAICYKSQRLSVVNYFWKKLHLRYLTRFWIRHWITLLPRKNLWLVNFSFVSFKLFFLHLMRYLFVFICLWLHFQSHSEVQCFYNLFTNTLSVSCQIQKVAFENYNGIVNFLSKDKIVVKTMYWNHETHGTVMHS